MQSLRADNRLAEKQIYTHIQLENKFLWTKHQVSRVAEKAPLLPSVLQRWRCSFLA